MRVADAIAYTRVTTLWTRKVGNGTLRCELLRANKPARRRLQLVAEYDHRFLGGVLHTVVVEDELEEARVARRLEATMLVAQAQPTGA